MPCGPHTADAVERGVGAMPVTTGMVGQGFYNRNSAPQMAAIEHVLPWLDEAVAVLPLGGAAPIGLADFGCSEGRNSIALMQRLVPALRRRTPRDIMTVHSDLPTNDFSALFRDLRPEGRSVFAAADVSSCAVAGSMFDRLLPRGSVHLAMTFNAIGFLSRKPVDRLPGGTVLVSHASAELRAVLRDMMKYSNNMTAEAVGMAASMRAGVGDHVRSGRAMSDWAAAACGAAHLRLVDHSGLAGASRVAAADMVRMLTRLGVRHGFGRAD